MESNSEAGPGAAVATGVTPVERMRAAVNEAVAVAPAFLRGDVDADHMAHAMLRAVSGYVVERHAAGGDAAASAENQMLERAVAELQACGSGYLAGRCDGACVARTMMQMVREFGSH